MKKKLKKMLLVDNDPMHWQLFQLLFGQKLFEEFKMIILFVGSCEEAMKIISEDSKEEIKLAVIDLMMPVVHGVELSANIEKVRSNIPIIISSSGDVISTKEVIKKANISIIKGFFILPYSKEEIFQKIRNALVV